MVIRKNNEEAVLWLTKFLMNVSLAVLARANVLPELFPRAMASMRLIPTLVLIVVLVQEFVLSVLPQVNNLLKLFTQAVSAFALTAFTFE